MAKKKENGREKAAAAEPEIKAEQVLGKEQTAQPGTEQERPAETVNAELESVKAQLAELSDRHLRTLAEYDNFRKRSQKEREQVYGDAQAAVLSSLLPILDNFERAAAGGETSLEDYRKGVGMIYTQLLTAFKKLGAEPFGEEGEDFDPNLHNAVMHEQDESAGENKIAQVFSKGYKMGDKILRPAVVKVVN